MKTATKEKITFAKWDPAEIIESKENVIAFLEDTIEENDPEFLLETIGHIARSKGMTQVARELNMSRKGLYKALATDGNPSFKTVFKLLDLLGLQIKVEQKSRNKRAQEKSTGIMARKNPRSCLRRHRLPMLRGKPCAKKKNRTAKETPKNSNVLGTA